MPKNSKTETPTNWLNKETEQIALKALKEITPENTYGNKTGEQIHDPQTAALLYECLLPGYPGWHWNITLTKLDPQNPATITELSLQPGENAITAPPWIPWAERLANYQHTQAQQAFEQAQALAAAAEIDDEDDFYDNDFNDFDDEFDGVILEGEENN